MFHDRIALPRNGSQIVYSQDYSLYVDIFFALDFLRYLENATPFENEIFRCFVLLEQCLFLFFAGARGKQRNFFTSVGAYFSVPQERLGSEKMSIIIRKRRKSLKQILIWNMRCENSKKHMQPKASPLQHSANNMRGVQALYFAGAIFQIFDSRSK